jgi:hypothetical protein
LLVGTSGQAQLKDDADALQTLFSEIGYKPGSVTITPKGSLKDGVLEIPLQDHALEMLGEGHEPKKVTLSPYRPYSLYPFALRDIAVWTPEGTEETEVSLLIQKEAGELLLRMDLFDTFTKQDRTSYAFRLVFEAPDRTLADVDLDPVMTRITETLNAQEGWEVR